MSQHASDAHKDNAAIRPIDNQSVHRITSGQVVIDLQTAVKELVENSLDAGATNIEVRFHNYGLKSIEVIDNGSGVAPTDYDSIALKHHTSKLASFEDLSTVLTFGFRGEALSSLCALSDGVSVTTATSSEAPMGTVLEMDRSGRIKNRNGKVARQRGTTVSVTGLFKPLPVRRKELERNIKREFGKALSLLNAYALVPCTKENRGVRLTVTNTPEGGRKTVQLRTDGTPSIKSSATALWGSRALDNAVDLELEFEVETEKAVLKRQGVDDPDVSGLTHVQVRGLISKFAVNSGRTTTDRQFFFVNGRPYNPSKVQKAFNEVYRSFNANQSPFIVADFILPTHACDINVSPDKRTIFLHSENNLLEALKNALEETFSSSRSTYDVGLTGPQNLHPKPQRLGPSQSQSHSQPSSDGVSPTAPGSDVGNTSLVNVDNPSIPVASLPMVAVDVGDPPASVSMGRPDPSLLGDDTQPEPRSSAREPLFLPDNADEAPTTSITGARPASGSPAPASSLIPRRRTRSESGAPDGTEIETERSASTPTEDDAGYPAPATHINGSGTSGVGAFLAASPSASASSLAGGSNGTATGAGAGTSAGDRRKTKPVQMVLSTRNASWNLRRDDRGEDEGDEGRAKKRPRLDQQRLVHKVSFRTKIRAFAAAGSQVPRPEDEDEEGDEDVGEGDEEEGGADEERDELDEDEGEEMEETRGRAQSRSARERDEDAHREDAAAAKLARKRRAPTSSEPNVHPTDMIAQVSGQASSEEVEVPSADFEVGVDGLPPSSGGPLEDWDIMDIDSPHIAAQATATSSDVVDLTEYDAIDADQDNIIDSEHKVVTVQSGHATLTIRFNLERIASRWKELIKDGSSSSLMARSSFLPDVPVTQARRSEGDGVNPEAAGFDKSVDDAKASATLSRIIRKSDFGEMEILGQFNLGFIVARRHTCNGLASNTQGVDGGGGSDDPANNASASTLDDLFIVDQHAADEKYNFETLQQTTTIQSQKLFRPQPLQLTAADELLATENIDVLQRNGFELAQLEDPEAASGSRLCLVAQPVSKSTMFDMRDLEEIIHLMQDRPKGTMVRCSKARAMFAMRACRKSIMVGKPLTQAQMTSVVRHMGTMDLPWNCPHGRPTMRHLVDLTAYSRLASRERQNANSGSRAQPIQWGEFGGSEAVISFE